MTSVARVRLVLACLAAAVAAGVVYLNALDNPFVYDDRRLIDENPALTDISDIRRVVMSDVTRPVVTLTYAIDRTFWGSQAFGFHVTNILLHMLNVVLLFTVVFRSVVDWNARTDRARTLLPGPAAFVAALLLAVHPLMTQAVTYIAGRSELLATFFVLSALLVAGRWLQRDRLVWLLAASALWGLALGSKETAIMFPGVLLLYAWWVMSPAERAAHSNGLALLVVTALAFAIARTVLFLTVETGDPLTIQWSLGVAQIDVLRRYLTLLVAPRGQTIFHAVAPFDGLADPRLWWALIVAAGVLAWTALVARRVPIAAWGMAWFLLALVPPAALVFFNRGEPMAEHRAYLAGCGAFVAVGALASRVAERVSRRGWVARLAGGAALVLIALSLAGRTVARNDVWSSRVALWTEAAGYAPSHWVPQLALGEALHDAGQHQDAVRAFERSIALHAEEPAAYLKLGICLIEGRRLVDAEVAFARLAELVPGSVEAANGLATVALAAGDTAEARNRFLHTLEVEPLNVEARRGLAAVAESQGNYAEALHRCEEIALLAPGLPDTDACIDRNRRRVAEAGAIVP